MAKEPGCHMRSEIAEQPSRVHAALDAALPRLDHLRRLMAETEFVILLGRGSSRSACSYGALALQHLTGVPAFVASPADIAWGSSALPLERGFVVAVSQSGQSTEMVAAAEKIRARQGQLVIITNSPSSPLADLVDDARLLECKAGTEKAVPATKSFTTSLACLLALAQPHRPAAVETAAAELPAAMYDVIDGASVLQLGSDVAGLVVVGEGFATPVAEEGAIKFREVLKMLVASLESSEFLHGSITSAQPDVGVIALAVDKLGSDLAAQVVREAADRGAPTFGIGPKGVGADQEFTVPEVPPEWEPFMIVCALQHMAMAAGITRGLDPDAPVGLSKVTRIGASGAG